jgi:hypothetical protein
VAAKAAGRDGGDDAPPLPAPPGADPSVAETLEPRPALLARAAGALAALPRAIAVREQARARPCPQVVVACRVGLWLVSGVFPGSIVSLGHGKGLTAVFCCGTRPL